MKAINSKGKEMKRDSRKFIIIRLTKHSDQAFANDFITQNISIIAFLTGSYFWDYINLALRI